MVNRFFTYLIVIGLILCFIFNTNATSIIIDSSFDSLKLVYSIFPIMALWLGIMNIALKSGLLNKISKLVNPLFKIIFKEIPVGHESLGYITSNFILTMFGLSNAATPFGIKAMESLQTLNKTDTASNSMITFLVLNTSGLTIIPSTVISLRNMYNSSNPEYIIPFCIFASFLSLITGLIIDKIFRRIYG